MNRSEIFLSLVDKAQQESRHITYKEFNENLQWDINDFLHYRELCENVMYAVNTVDNMSKQFQEIKYKEHNMRILLVSQPLQILSSWLHEQVDVCFDMDYIYKYGYFLLSKQEYYRRRLEVYDEERVRISYIHKGSDDFRFTLEGKYHLFITGKPVLYYIDKGICCSLDEAKRKRRLLDDEMSSVYASEPDNIDDYDDIHLVEQWAKAKGDFIDKIIALNNSDDELSDYIDSVEKGLEFIAAAHTIYVYQNTVPCQKEKHDIEAITGSITNSKGDSVVLNINHCKDCNIFFIDYDEYISYQKRYGNLICKAKFVTANERKHSSNRSEDSPLIHCGYNVSQSENLTSTERQNILSEIIKKHILTKDEVINYLNTFIRVNGAKPSMKYAVQKWTEDLDFVDKIETPKYDPYGLDDISERILYGVLREDCVI